MSGKPWSVRKNSRWSKENILKQNSKSPAQEVFDVVVDIWFYVVYRRCLVKLQSLQHRNKLLHVYAMLAQWGPILKKRLWDGAVIQINSGNNNVYIGRF